MLKFIIVALLMITLSSVPSFAYQSLTEVFNQASGNGVYDKYIELNPAVEYEGDLFIPAGLNVFIDGHGALIHGSTTVCICVFRSNLDIQNCVITGGYGGIYIGIQSSGNYSNNTITGCFDSGIRTYEINHSVGTYIWDNIITDCFYGVFCIDGEHPEYIGYNTVYNSTGYRYAEFCPG